MSAPKDPEKRERWKNNISKGSKGKTRNKGRKRSPEAIEKTRVSNIGRKHTEEWKRAASERMKGNQYTKGFKHTEETKQKDRESAAKFVTRLEDPEFRKEFGSKVSKGLTGRKLSEEHKHSLRLSSTGRKHTEESKQKMSKAKQGHPVSDEQKELNRQIATDWWANLPEEEKEDRKEQARTWWDSYPEESKQEFCAAASARLAGNKHALGMRHSEETKELNSKLSREWWANPEFATRVLHNSALANSMNCPNGLEIKLQTLLDELFPGEWIFTGDGSRPVGGKHPDFTHTVYPLLIETYGSYWHKGADPQDRIDFFTQFGYDTLVIWDYELARDRETVVQEVLKFAGGLEA